MRTTLVKSSALVLCIGLCVSIASFAEEPTNALNITTKTVPDVVETTAEAGNDLPANFRDYFDRAESAKKTGIAKINERIEREEVTLKGAPKQMKRVHVTKIAALKKELEKFQKAPAHCLLSSNPQPDEIGQISNLAALAVLDDKSVFGFANVERGQQFMLLKLDSTKNITAAASLEKATKYQPEQTWLVRMATPEELESCKKWVPRKYSIGNKLLAAEAINKSKLEKYRKIWESSAKP